MEYGKTNEILKASLVKVVSNNIMFYNEYVICEYQQSVLRINLVHQIITS